MLNRKVDRWIVARTRFSARRGTRAWRDLNGRRDELPRPQDEDDIDPLPDAIPVRPATAHRPALRCRQPSRPSPAMLRTTERVAADLRCYIKCGSGDEAEPSPFQASAAPEKP